MVSLLIVSHSAKLAEGVKELADQMSGGVVQIAAAGGMADGALGTSTDLIRAGLEAITSQDGTLILVDLGSAVLSAEAVLETLDSAAPILISDAPLAEGALLAAIEASIGASLEQTAAAALQAREMVKVHR
jgi:phosphoenolpyruvate---glycerone phosphotransferase subunit DhaM